MLIACVQKNESDGEYARVAASPQSTCESPLYFLLKSKDAANIIAWDRELYILLESKNVSRNKELAEMVCSNKSWNTTSAWCLSDSLLFRRISSYFSIYLDGETPQIFILDLASVGWREGGESLSSQWFANSPTARCRGNSTLELRETGRTKNFLLWCYGSSERSLLLPGFHDFNLFDVLSFFLIFSFLGMR